MPTTQNASINAVDTMRWQDQQLYLLDQRLLPRKVEYLHCTSAAAVAQAIKQMVVRGAPALSVAAAFGVAVEALRFRQQPELWADAVQQAIDTLAASRPTAVNLFWALDKMRHCLAQYASASVAQRTLELCRQAEQIFQDDVRINQALGEFGAALLPDVATVLTHCNAGALATAGHGTALGVIYSARNAGKKIDVVVDETRPLLQGARLTAWELSRAGVPVTLISDNMAGAIMATRRIDAVIVGADRVAANGDVANKIGTYMVAVLAAYHHIPFYVACPLSTLDLNCPDGAHIPIEQRPAHEVTGFGHSYWAAAGIGVANPAFDVTPAHLVRALITECGVIHHPNQQKLASLKSAEVVAEMQ